MRSSRYCVQMVFLLLLLAVPAGYSSAASNTALVTNPQLRVRIAMAEPLGASKGQDLRFLPFVTLVDSAGVPGGTNLSVANGPDLDLRRFQLAGAHILITSSWSREGAAPRVELRAFDVTTGSFIFGHG